VENESEPLLGSLAVQKYCIELMVSGVNFMGSSHNLVKLLRELKLIRVVPSTPHLPEASSDGRLSQPRDRAIGKNFVQNFGNQTLA
jgi:hypothetical protein